MENGHPVFNPRSRHDRQHRPLPLHPSIRGLQVSDQQGPLPPANGSGSEALSGGRCPAQGHPGCHQQSPGPETETSRPLEVTPGQRTLETVGLGGAALGIRPSTPPRMLQPARRLRRPRRGHHRGHSGVRHRGSLTPACGRSPIPRRPQLRVSGEQRPGTQLGPEKHVGHFREGSPASSVIRKKTPTGRRWEAGYHRDGAVSGG